MTGNFPTVMVSSTFYDLRQIRSDIADFLKDQLGYRVLISEHSSFPVDPDSNTIENCRERVEKNADILILFIGGRYGYVDSSSLRSVTNIEYLAARAKGIPIYAFIEQRVLALLATWEQNPTADFSHDVDNPALFKFISEIRNRDKIWTHEFHGAKEIVTALRTQFAYLMHDGLAMAAKIKRFGIAAELRHLSPIALRIAIERPLAWEYRLFAQVVCDEVSQLRSVREDHKLQLWFGKCDDVTPDGFNHWMNARFSDLRNLIDPLGRLINIQAAEAFGLPGVAGDTQKILFTGSRIALVYRNAIEWSQRVRHANVPRHFHGITREMAQFTDDIIAKIESFGPDQLKQIEDALSAPEGSSQKNVKVDLVIGMPNVENFNRAVDKAISEMRRGGPGSNSAVD